MAVQLRFLGATDTVTGSRTLVESGSARILIDCGLFQGYKKLRERNWLPLSVEPNRIDAVVLTHAHIDHSGYLPRLVKLGFGGRIFCTPGTQQLLKILLPDSGYLQEEEARFANRHGTSKHQPALPLFTREEAEAVLRYVVPINFSTPFEPASGIRASYSRAGHILGSASLALQVEGTRITFTGDVGRSLDPIMRPPALLEPMDVLVTESTYGDRRHPSDDVETELAKVIVETGARGGVVLVPSFAVGRAQHLLHLMARLKSAGTIGDVAVFLDSPMAVNATNIFAPHQDEHRLSPAECRAMCEGVTFCVTADQSKEIAQKRGPKVIISASGMATGGRVLHHLQALLPDRRNTVLFVGFQAAGTRGRSLLDGADEVKIFGKYVPVQAQIRKAEGLSAHADYAELLDWFGASKIAPRRVLVNHGEPAAADAFRRRVKDRFGWQTEVADESTTYSV
ncbi:MAG: MBL fold metallo-hydrolase [Polyangiaceae bacterium]|nr:MBL fold metallo-hydrolase [Polyangiaceae bacterium]